MIVFLHPNHIFISRVGGYTYGPMNWLEKAKRLLKGKNASELSRAVHLPPSAIGAAVSKGNLPKADKAVKIARALGVSADWLFDDLAEWPPPVTGFGGAPDAELVQLLEARINRSKAMYLDLLKEAKQILDSKKSGVRPADYGDRLTNLMGRHCSVRPVYFGLLECLVETGNRIAEVDDIFQQILGIRLNWVSPEERAASQTVLERVRHRYAEAEAPWPSILHAEPAQPKARGREIGAGRAARPRRPRTIRSKGPS